MTAGPCGSTQARPTSTCHTGTVTAPNPPVQLDGDLAREVAERAAQRGERPEQLISEVLRRHFLLEVLERIWAHNPDQLTEDQALKLAYDELDAMRAERDPDRPA